MGWELCGQLVHGPAGVLGLAARELDVTLRRSLGDDLLALFERLRLLERLRLAAPMSYMLTVAMAFIRGSILAALMTKLPLPQMPMAPIRSRSTNGWVPRKSTAALKLSA